MLQTGDRVQTLQQVGKGSWSTPLPHHRHRHSSALPPPVVTWVEDLQLWLAQPAGLVPARTRSSTYSLQHRSYSPVPLQARATTGAMHTLQCA
mmetsp:Transcript_66743/g.155047  ORF Transcript_66743/g.155047 Transcript_66743/m.155047 type:complete len:93 (+) Transcript_66743:220-498(+)